MKVDIAQLKDIPKQFGIGVCVYGELSEEIQEWVYTHSLKITSDKNYTNIILPKDVPMVELFNVAEPYEYVDGFSPNLNKHLHLGHSSNFVLAKAFQKLGVGKNFIANLGDTVTGIVTKDEALTAFYNICEKFDYKVNITFFASQLKCQLAILEDGVGEYENTKVFDINGTKIVGIKSSGDTTYFYQDVALAETLDATTLYLTGVEQTEHFKLLKTLHNTVNHLPLGLVSISGQKMSSRVGNVLMFEDVLKIFEEILGDNPKLIWNVLAGFILKSAPNTSKNISLDDLENVKQSGGLYLSYTLAKLKSAGLLIKPIKIFNSVELQLKYIKAVNKLQPNILFLALLEKAKEISILYESHTIKDNLQNQKLFTPLAEDLLFGMSLLGMYDIEKV